MHTMYADASNNTPSYTHFSLYMVWRVHPLRFVTRIQVKLNIFAIFALFGYLNSIGGFVNALSTWYLDFMGDEWYT